MDEKNKNIPHSLIIDNRKNLTITGVTDVENFDDESICLYTQYGQVSIRGENLQVSVLNTENGDVTASGKINSVAYSEKTEKNPRFFARVFR